MNVQSYTKASISLFLLISLLFLSISSVYGDVVLDSYTASTAYGYLIRNVHWGSDSAQAQSWNQHLYTKAKVTSIKLKAYKVGNPSGTLYCKIASHAGTYGTSSKPDEDLETSTNSYSIASLSSLSNRPTTMTFTFAGDTEILKDDPYTFYVYCSGGTLDGSNYVVIQGYKGHDGNKASPTSIESIWATSSNDLYFQVYGLEIPSVEWHDIATWNFNLKTRQWIDIANWIFDLASPSDFPIGPILLRVAISVTLNGDAMDKINITVSGGPSNFTFWKMTDSFGEAILRLKKGTYLFFISHDIYLVEHNISIVKHCIIHFELNSTEYRMVRDWTTEIIQIVSGTSCFIVLLAIYTYHEQKTVSKQWKKIKSLKGKPKKEIKKKLKGKR